MGVQKQMVKDGYLDALDICLYGIYYGFKCQKFTQGKRLTGIKEAKKLCENDGGELAAYLDNHEFQTIFEHKKHFFRKGGMLWIGAVYDIEEDGNRWIWPYTSEGIRDIKTSPPTDQDGFCGVMDAQMNGGMYEPFIRGHSCDEWSPNTGVLCMIYSHTESPTGFSDTKTTPGWASN